MRRVARLVVLVVIPALINLTLAIAFAPVLVACLPVTRPGSGGSRVEMYERVFQRCFFAMPPAIAAWGWFLAWTLHMPPHGQVGAVAVGILFGIQSVGIGFLLAFGAGFSAEGLEPGSPPRPLVFVFDCFCDTATGFVFFSLPLSAIVAVVGLLT